MTDADDADGGWSRSAGAWIAAQGEAGDFGRVFVLDRPMIERVRASGARTALDVGCGEGRFCRVMRDMGIATVGIDPTERLLDRARALDPKGDYRLATAETMEVPEAGFDLVVSYLSLIDIPDLDAAIRRMAAALRPGGRLLIANLNPYNTAGMPVGWLPDDGGFVIDDYLEERPIWVEWRGIRIRNWHRPMARYMQALLGAGLTLTHFDEPAPHGGPEKKARKYARVPYFHIMEWQKG